MRVYAGTRAYALLKCGVMGACVMCAPACAAVLAERRRATVQARRVMDERLGKVHSDDLVGSD